MAYSIEKQKMQEKIVIIAYSLLVVKAILDTTQLLQRPETVDTMLIVVFIVLIGYKLINQTYTRLGIILFVLTTILFVYSSISVNYFSLFNSYLLISAVQDIDIKKILKVSIWTKGLILSLHISAYGLLYLLGSSMIATVYRNGVQRHNFFIGHPNLFAAYLVWTCIEIIYVYYEHIKKSHLGLIWLINMIFYGFTNSNTGIIVLTVVIIMVIIDKNDWRLFNKFLSGASKYGFAFFSLMFPIIIIIYIKIDGILLVLWIGLNNALTGRLLYGAYAYDTYGFSVLGRSISFPTKTYWKGHWLDEIYFDNSYVWLFIIFGIVYLLIISIAFIMIESETTNIEKIIIVGFSLYGIMEAYIVNIAICFPLILIGKYIYKQKKSVIKNQILVEDPLWKQS